MAAGGPTCDQPAPDDAAPDDAAFMALARTIVAGDTAAAIRLLARSPALASVRLVRGASREDPTPYFFDEILHYVYGGDTALHVAAAGYRRDVARDLVERGADVSAKNRRGAEPLHYAVDGAPGSAHWDPAAQGATVAYLIGVGADPNAVDHSGVMPLHRAVRTRCGAAVRALLEGGADPRGENKSGSTPMKLAIRNTGRGGTGSADAKEQQEEIIRLLEQHGG